MILRAEQRYTGLQYIDGRVAKKRNTLQAPEKMGGRGPFKVEAGERRDDREMVVQ